MTAADHPAPGPRPDGPVAVLANPTAGAVGVGRRPGGRDVRRAGGRRRGRRGTRGQLGRLAPGRRWRRVGGAG
ncbi:hypothetical protein, partial [Micromonospora harpali]